MSKHQEHAGVYASAPLDSTLQFRAHAFFRAALFFFAILLAGPAQSAQAVRTVDATPSGAAIASAHPLATEAGMLMLSVGGNAFDAAVAVSAALAVVEPTGSGLGGGGFWLLHRAEDGFQIMVDGREKAPLAASADMFLDKNGNYNEDRSRSGALSAGIPGEPAALVHLAERYGKLPLAQSLAPAIRLARGGFPADERLCRIIDARRNLLMASPAAAAVFLQNGAPPAPGTLILQPDLADTLDRLAADGAKGFYAGPTAKALVRGVRDAGGIWSAKDLAQYSVVERAPLIIRYNNMRIVTAPLPSAGGMVMGIVLNILSGYELQRFESADRKHLVVEAMRRAYHDRAAYLGDPDFIATPLQLLSQSYADSLRNSIRLNRATPSSRLSPIGTSTREGGNTTHFSIIDQAGNRVAATLSINLPFGAGIMPAGTGVLLNNEMDDFSVRGMTANVYGLVGGSANAIAPGKRMLSSMSPTFVETDDRIAVLGTPGGSRIISMVLEGILAFANGADARTIVSQPRYHHQYLPDEIAYEEQALGPEEQQSLQQRGHTLKSVDDYGNMQAVIWNRSRNRMDAASDPRGIGGASIRAVAPVQQNALPEP